MPLRRPCAISLELAKARVEHKQSEISRKCKLLILGSTLKWKRKNAFDGTMPPTFGVRLLITNIPFKVFGSHHRQ